VTAQRHWAEHLRLSHHGAAFIAVEEGIRVRPYYDSRHLVTTGVGHLVTPAHSTITAADVKRWTFPSAHAAVDYFRNHDVVVYENAVRAALGKASLTQAQYDMCVSLCFNIGVGGFAGSRVARYIHKGRMRLAALAFYGWAKPRVLWGRRNRESYRFRVAHW
jgi:lysozyme